MKEETLSILTVITLLNLQLLSDFFSFFSTPFIRKMTSNSVTLLRRVIVLNESDQPLTYKIPDELGLERAKLVLEDDGFTRKKDIHTWNATNGKNLEGFCKVYSEFNVVMRDWGYANNGARRFEGFRQFLADRPRTIFDVRSQINRNDLGNNVAAFNRTVSDLAERIAGDNPRDQASEYILDPHYMRKRHSEDVFTHGSRLELLFSYHDLLPGTTPSIQGNNIEQVRRRKMLLFHSFPLEWQSSYAQYRGPPNNDSVTWQNILQYMDSHKKSVDTLKIRRMDANSRHGGRARGGRVGRGHGRGGSYAGRGFSRGNYPYNSGNFRNYQGNFRGNNFQAQGQRYPPGGRYNGYQNPFQRYNGGGRGNGGRNFGRFGNRNVGGRAPQQQHYLAESHFGTESSASERSSSREERDRESQGREPSAENTQQMFAQMEQQPDQFYQGSDGFQNDGHQAHYEDQHYNEAQNMGEYYDCFNFEDEEGYDY